MSSCCSATLSLLADRPSRPTMITASGSTPTWAVLRSSVDLSSGDVTLSGATSRAGYLTINGVLGTNRNVVVPNDWQGAVFNNTSGAYTVTVNTSGGSGVVVAQAQARKPAGRRHQRRAAHGGRLTSEQVKGENAWT